MTDRGLPILQSFAYLFTICSLSVFGMFSVTWPSILHLWTTPELVKYYEHQKALLCSLGSVLLFSCLIVFLSSYLAIGKRKFFLILLVSSCLILLVAAAPLSFAVILEEHKFETKVLSNFCQDNNTVNGTVEKFSLKNVVYGLDKFHIFCCNYTFPDTAENATTCVFSREYCQTNCVNDLIENVMIPCAKVGRITSCLIFALTLLCPVILLSTLCRNTTTPVTQKAESTKPMRWGKAIARRLSENYQSARLDESNEI